MLKAIDESVSRVFTVMQSYSRPWAFAGGWAVDLFARKCTRPHADFDIAVFREDQEQLRAVFAGWHFSKAVGGRLETWEGDERLALPVHELHAIGPEPQQPRIEFLLNERSGPAWQYRRNPAITLAVDRAIVKRGLVPLLAPEIVLLFKSKAPRPTDDQDFTTLLPLLVEDQRDWLRAALTAMSPAHPWLDDPKLTVVQKRRLSQ